MDPSGNAQPAGSAPSHRTRSQTRGASSLPPAGAQGGTTRRGKKKSTQVTSSHDQRMDMVMRQMQDMQETQDAIRDSMRMEMSQQRMYMQELVMGAFRQMAAGSAQQVPPPADIAGPSRPAPPLAAAAVEPQHISQASQVPPVYPERQEASRVAEIGRPQRGEEVAPVGLRVEQQTRGQSSHAPVEVVDRAVRRRSGGAEGTAESQSAEVQKSAREIRHKKTSKRESRIADAFYRMNPPTFADGDCQAAEDWLSAISKTLDYLNCSDHQRVQLAVYKLMGDADHWWSNQKDSFESQQIEITWERFKQAFFQQYFPSTLRLEKAREFAELRQGTMTVSQYASKFASLIRFAPEISSNAEIKQKRFVDGLVGTIRSKVDLAQCKSYGEAFDRAMLAEIEYNEMRQAMRDENQSSANKEEPPFKRQAMQNNGQGLKASSSKIPKKGKPQKRCGKCQRFHPGPCRFQNGACYKCGQTGHQPRDCPV